MHDQDVFCGIIKNDGSYNCCSNITVVILSRQRQELGIVRKFILAAKNLLCDGLWQ
jgi:hypothetical protein